jgi:tetratricopeptide (TPR) repeat protein/transglutaminase-like putative cysteine protease
MFTHASRRCPIWLSSCLLVVVFALPVRAADWPVARGPSNEPVPFRYDPATARNVPAPFLDDAAACTLYSGINYLVEADGTIETITHEVTRLNSRKAIDKLGEYRTISYTPAYEKLTLNEARIHKADGRIVPIEAKHVQLRDLGTDFQVYDQGKQLIISFPSLEVGDVFEVRWTTRGKNPEHGGHFFTRYSFGDDRYPVAVDELRIRLPRDRPLKFKVTGGTIEPTVTDKDGQRTYHWRVTDRAQLPQDDSLPPKEELRLGIVCSTFQTWDEVFKWKQGLRRDCWECTTELRKIVADVTRDLKTPTDKARALTYWVRRHIRYLSLGEKHDYTPHTPAQILDTRFGDCKDTSQLLAVMLREAGIPVALVTLGVLDDGQIQEEVPSPWGTHAILVVTIDGNEHWIDTTVSLAAWDYLPKDDRNRLTYVVDDKGLRLVRTPKMTPEENRIEQTTKLTVAADGSSRSERTSTYTGAAALSRRNDWVDVPSGERRRLVSGELQDAQTTARLLRFSFDEEKIRDFDQPVQARFLFEVGDHFPGDSDREGNFTDSPLWGRLLAYTLDFDRTVPLELGSPFESKHRYIVDLPPGYKLEAPPLDREMESKWGTFRRTVKYDDARPRHLEVEYSTRLEKTRVEPKDFAEFRKFQEFVSKHYRVWLTLKPGGDPADIPILEAILAVAPGDEGIAEMLANLYLDEEKPEEARRVVKRARWYHPEHVKLAELSVHVAANAEEEEVAYRELVRLFPGTYKYALALADVLAERGRPTEVGKVLQSVLKDGSAEEKAKAHYYLARADFDRNKFREALKHLESAEDADANIVATATALDLKARIHEKLEQPKEAADAYRALLKVDPNTMPALEAMVRLELTAGNDGAALQYLRRYSLLAEDAKSLARAAAFHFQMGRSDDAFDLATRSLDEGADNLAERTLGLVHVQRGEYEKALNHLEETDLDADVLAGLVRCNLCLGRVSKAAKETQRAAKKLDKAAIAAMALLVDACEKRRGIVLGAVKVPADKMAAWQTAAEAFVGAEFLYNEQQPAAQIQTLLTGAFRDRVELGPAFALRGLLALEKGRVSRALADAERAVALSPQEARGYYVRGRARLERGDKEALADLTRAASLSQRKDAAMLHWLAASQFRAGQKKEALATQREAVEHKPDDAELKEQLDEFEKEMKGNGR